MAFLFLHATASHAEAMAAKSRLQGQVLHALTGQVIAGAQVTVGQQSTTTDARGRFDLRVDAAAGQTVLAARPGYARGVSRVDALAGSTAQATLRLVPVSSVASWPNATAPVSVLVPGSSAQVALPASSLVDRSSGQLAPGAVMAQVTTLDPRTRPAAMPGSYLQSVGGSTQAIESFGVIHIEAKDRATGQPRELIPGAMAVVHIPAGQPGAALPTTVALSHLDESSGLWVQEGSATLRGHGASLHYEGTVSRLGYWSATRPVDTIQVHGSVCLPENTGAVTVRTDDVGHAMAAEAPALPNGGFHVALRAGGQATLQAQAPGQSSDPVTLGPSMVDIELTDCLPLH